MRKNLHAKPFDEGTLKKLDIFELYTAEWLPTFIMSGAKCVWIFDLFAGTGYDLNHVAGSPIRILQQLKRQLGNMYKKETKAHLVFNEFDKIKYEQLKKSCNEFIESDSELARAKTNGLFKCEILQKDVTDLFPKLIQSINKYPSLVFLDQNGVKFLAKEYFDPLINSHSTDFLFFVSSSYIKRFGETDEFSKVIPFDLKHAKNIPITFIHRYILDELKKRIPEGNRTRLYPFSIKKGVNIYGIVFGASHPRAVDKFLATAWKENEINGEANFDIDEDNNKGMPDLFGYKPLTKIEKFKQELRSGILSKKLTTNKDVYDFTIEHGHIPAHAHEEMKKMKEEGLLLFSRSPMANYEQVYKKNNIITYDIKGK